MEQSAIEHLQVCYLFIEQAEEELDEGDTLQASEKAWGAAVRAVKAVSVTRGWSHETYTAIRKSVARIAGATQDQELKRLFKTAYGLHQNFYQGNKVEEDVRECLAEVRLFIDRIERVIWRT